MINPLPTPTAEVRTADTIQSLQNLISRHATQLKELKEDKKNVSEKQKSILENDALLDEKEQEAEAYLQAIKERKAEIKGTEEFVSLKIQRSELVEQEKEISETLSHHLVNYHSLTNSNVFDNVDGSQMEFKTKASFTSKQLSLF